MALLGTLSLIVTYNTAPANEDVHDPKAWEGKILCSGQERGVFQRDNTCHEIHRTCILCDRQIEAVVGQDRRLILFRRLDNNRRTNNYEE